jgi:Aldehyde dehydrogenase family
MAITVETPTAFAAPGQPGSPVELKSRYDNFIGGEWIAPTTGEYRENLTPATGKPFCEVAHSAPDDVELALDAAHAAKDAWGWRSRSRRQRRGTCLSPGSSRSAPPIGVQASDRRASTDSP